MFLSLRFVCNYTTILYFQNKDKKSRRIETIFFLSLAAAGESASMPSTPIDITAIGRAIPGWIWKGGAHGAPPGFYFLSRYKNVTICPRVQLLFGLKVVSLVPFVIPFVTAQQTALS